MFVMLGALASYGSRQGSVFASAVLKQLSSVTTCDASCSRFPITYIATP
jgi:hypothetical protein